MKPVKHILKRVGDEEEEMGKENIKNLSNIFSNVRMGNISLFNNRNVLKVHKMLKYTIVPLWISSIRRAREY